MKIKRKCAREHVPRGQFNQLYPTVMNEVGENSFINVFFTSAHVYIITSLAITLRLLVSS